MTLDQFVKKLESAGTAGVREAMRRTARDARLDMEEAAKRFMRERMNRRTGNLIGSLTSFVTEEEGAVNVAVQAGGGAKTGAPVKYGKIQEEGGMVRPVNGKYLRIPLGPAKTQAGVDRYATPLRLTAPKEFFFWENPRTGKKFLRKRSDGKIWYLLTEGPVTIPPHWFLRDARDQVQATAGGMFAEHMRDVLGMA